MTGWFLFIVATAFVVGVVYLYNRLVVQHNRLKNAYAQIDVQLTRRHDLIPNLVAVAKRYLAHEQATLQAVIEARGRAITDLNALRSGKAGADIQLNSSENLLDMALGRMMVVVEAYPDLKADQNMRQLSEELTSTENRLAFARQAYNDSVLDYMNSREQFPANLLSDVCGFKEVKPIIIDDHQVRTVPQVRL